MSRDEHQRALQDLGEALNSEELLPDDSRDDWAPLRPRIRQLRDGLEAALGDAQDGSPRHRAAVAELVGPMAALLHASGDRPGAAALLLAALPAAPDAETHQLWTAGERYLPAYADLERARYHQRRKEQREAERLAAPLHDHPAEPLSKAARAITGQAAPKPRPRTKPAFYREGGFWKTVAAVGALVGAYAVIANLSSPNRKVKQEIAALRPDGALPAEAREQRIAQLESLIDREARAGRVDRATLAEGALVLIDLIAAPPGNAAADGPAALSRLRALPAAARSDALLDRVAALVRGWIGAMNLGSPGAAEGALRLCSTARGLDVRPDSPLITLEDDVRGQLADRLLQQGWPADAFLQQSMRRHSDSLARAGQALGALPDSPSPWLALAPRIDAWLARARSAAPGPTALVAERLAAARQHQKVRAAGGPPALDGLELPALDALRARFPQDQEIATARAEARRGRGDLTGAIADLESVGSAGHLIRPAQNLLAELMESTGKTEDAEALLDRLFALDFPAYEQARDRYDAAMDTTSAGLRVHALAAVNNGMQPDSEESARRVNEWIDNRLLDDPALRALRDELKARSPVVDMALRLGMLRLGRALEQSGDARARTLARAEQDFLAVSAYAGGSVQYHLGLGQVYHRMGKGEAGDRQLSEILARHDPELDLSVVRVYRDLDMIPRATELALAVQGKAPQATAREAALVLSLMADQRAEKERWLRKADPALPAVRANLAELEGDRLFDQGDLAGADRKYAEVLSIWLADAETDSSAANNGALIATWRYRCTGDARHLATAIRLFDTSVRLAPSSAIAAGNAATAFLHKAHLGVLDRWIDVAPLRLAPWQANYLLSAVMRGPLRAEAVAALKASADGRRSLGLHKRQQLLAPRSVEGYEGQVDWYRWVGDQEALRALQTGLANTTLELAQRKAAYDRRTSEEERAERETSRRSLLRLLEGTEPRLPRPETSVRARRTHAALWLLRGLQQAGRPDEARPAFDALLRARALWPELTTLALSEAALSIALDEAAAAHAPLGARWKKERITTDADWFAYDLVRAGDAATLRALKQSAALAALATERRAQLAIAAGGRAQADVLEAQQAAGLLTDWTLGRLLDDPRLVAAGVQHARWPVIQATAAANLILFPYSDETQRWSRGVEQVAGWRE